MKRSTIIWLLGLLIVKSVIILFLLINFNSTITGEVISEHKYTYTKAVCNETHCQDYEIACSGNRVISSSPITGAVLHPLDWEDNRENKSEIICNLYNEQLK